MSLFELIPLVESLSQPDQVTRFKHRATKISNPDLQGHRLTLRLLRGR
jgi:hypothetical protein